MKRCERHGVLNCALCRDVQVHVAMDGETVEMLRIVARIRELEGRVEKARERALRDAGELCFRCRVVTSTFVTVSGFKTLVPRFEQCRVCEGEPEATEYGHCSACNDAGSRPVRLCSVCLGGERIAHLADEVEVQLAVDACPKCHGKTPRFRWVTQVCAKCAAEEPMGGRASVRGAATLYTADARTGDESRGAAKRRDAVASKRKPKLRAMCPECQQRYAQRDLGGVCWPCHEESRRVAGKDLRGARDELAAIRAMIEAMS